MACNMDAEYVVNLDGDHHICRVSFLCQMFDTELKALQ